MRALKKKPNFLDEDLVWKKMLLTKSNLKTNKNLIKHNVATISLNLAPFKESIMFNVCSHAGECAFICLNESGHNRFPSHKVARISRTEFLFLNPDGFTKKLFRELDNFKKWCDKNGHGMAARLNCLSDLVWEVKLPEVFERYPDCIFYDYTKIPGRYQKFLDGKLPSNYHLTYSLSGESEESWNNALHYLGQGGTVAIVSHDEAPETYKGYPVVNGDESDARWKEKGCWVWLKAKGKAAKSKSKFVVGGCQK